MQNSPENLESPCKIPQRIWNPHEKFPREFGISIQESLLLWHPFVRIQSLETFITVPLFAFWWKLLHLGWYQSPHVSHSTISSHILWYLTSAEQFNLHMEVCLVTGTSLSLHEVHSIEVHSRSISHIVHTVYIGNMNNMLPA